MKIDKDFFKTYSILEIKKSLKNKEISPEYLINHSKNLIEKKISFNCITKSSHKELKNINFEKQLVFNQNKKLSCIPFLAKDIFNTNEFNTEMGSKIWKNFKAGNNARVIDSLIDNGSILIGKSTTAEFAVHHETECKNSIDVSRLPGTSSTGSAVAVSLGIVPFSLGTQTAGSIIRPASYNGIYAMKPSFGMIPRTGVLKTCDSLDTIGFLTSKFENIKTILDSIRVSGRNYPYVYENVEKNKNKIKTSLKNTTIGFIKTYTWKYIKDYNKKHIIEYVEKIKKKYNVYEIELDKSYLGIHKLHTKIYYKSLSYYFKREKKLGFKLSSNIKEIIKKGEKITSSEFKESLEEQSYLIEKFEKSFSNYDILITPGTSGIAPKIKDKEDDDSALIWTFLHLPVVFAPLFKDLNGMPFGIQFVAKKWCDYNLIKILELLKKDNFLI